MNKHTPTPWEINERTQYIENPNSGIVADVTKLDKANAEHIVKCVNAHDELMEFVEKYFNHGDNLILYAEATKLIEKYGE